MMFRLRLGIGLLLGLLSGPIGRADDKFAPPADSKKTVPVMIDFDSIRSALAGGNSKGSSDSNDPAKYRPYHDITDKATKHDGMLTLFQNEDHLYAEIRPDQFDQPMLSPITIARGLAMAGNPLNFGDEWILMFHRSGDKVQLVRRNIHVKAPGGTPLEKAVKQNYTDSILMALPIVALNQGQNSVIIDLADLYFTNFAQLPLGSMDRSRTTWSKVKAYPNNLELEVQATFGDSFYGSYSSGDEGIVDGRGITVVIHYSLVKLPESSYHARAADDRVGHFLNATIDYGSADPDGNVARMINRWRLEKNDPKAKLSAPKKQIVWYIEDTVPLEYRSAVEDGIREWNKAFERIGFRDAIAVRWQEPGRDEFDPEDINYCTFRWITTSMTYAMSCLRSNPLTGEMIDGDVIFDASWVRFWKNEYAILTGEPPVAGGQGQGQGHLMPGPLEPLAVGEIISTTLAAKQGYGQQPLLVQPLGAAGKVSLAPAEWSGLRRELLRRANNSGRSSCRFAAGMQTEVGLAALVMEEAVKENPDSKLPEDFLNQLIKEVVMHEVGHSLGLRHNFKASTMLDADQLNNTEITHAKGMVGSVMDYNPINIVPKGQKQGDFMTTTIGPYDYWAIEYAYKEVSGDEGAELKKVAARAPEHDLVFGTDSDFANADPLVNMYDLGSDVSRFAQDRITLAAQLLKNLDSKVVKDGESWARTKTAYAYLMRQYGNAADLVVSYVGGQSVSRHHKGDKDAVDPIMPISGEKQRAALSFLAANVWDDAAFKFSPALLRKLSKEHWDMGVGSSYALMMYDTPVNDRVLSIQKIALNHCLSGSVLSRLQQQELQAEPDARPLQVAEVFATITNAVFREVGIDPSKPLDTSKPTALACSTIRRNLQREYFRRLATIVLGERKSPMSDYYPFILFLGGGDYPADARSLARFHLKKIGDQIDKVLDTRDITLDDTCRAHFEELRQNIAKTLNADVTKNES